MASVPKQIHFVWLGNPEKPEEKPEPNKPEPLKPTATNTKGFVDRFSTRSVSGCKINTGGTPVPYTVHIWICGLSMVSSRHEALAKKVDKAIQELITQNKPGSWASNKEPPVIEPLTTPKGPLAEVLQEARAAFEHFDPRSLTADERKNIKFIEDFCSRPEHNFQLHFLDQDYARWTGPAQPAATRLFGHLIMFETLARGGNFGAASDMLRVQLLMEHGGIYCDHDTGFLKPFGDLKPPYGFLHAINNNPKASNAERRVQTNANMAATPINAAPSTPAEVTAAEGAFLTHYRNFILKKYTTDVFAKKESLEVFMGLKASHKPPVGDEPWSGYMRMTLDTTGPSAMRSALTHWIQEKSKVSHESEETVAAGCKLSSDLIVVFSAGSWSPDKDKPAEHK